MLKFVFTCGGTAGHVYPAVAVAGRLRQLFPDCQILFLGAEGKMEMELVPKEGYEIRPLKVTYLKRSKSLSALLYNMRSLKNVLAATREAKRILRSFKPDAVIGTGGYVCYPVLKAASDLGILTAVHESNALPGLTTKLLAKKVDRVMVGFEESRAYYPKPEEVCVTGTPVRGEFASQNKLSAKAELGLPADKKLVLSTWGSLGASHMNKIVADMMPELCRQQDFHFLHGCGSLYWERMSEKLKDCQACCTESGFEMREFIYDMPRVMAAADLILCRAGASTLAELTYMGKPAIIVPSPNVTGKHQEKNARVLEKAGGAKVLLEGQFDGDSLLQSIKELLEEHTKLEEMSRAMASLAQPDACENICIQILELLKESK